MPEQRTCNEIVRDEGFGEMECGEPAECETSDGPRCFFHAPWSGYFDRRGTTDNSESIYERSERRSGEVLEWDGSERVRR